MLTNNTVASPVANEIVAFKHYQDTESELKAMPASQVKHINLDTKFVVATALGVLPKLQPYHDQIAALPGYNIQQFEAIERFAGTLVQADAYHSIATSPPDDLVEVQAEGAELREVMYVDAQVQVRRGLINGDSLGELNGPVGYKNLGADLQSLSTIYFTNWDKLAGTTSVKQEEIQRAQQISFYLFRAAGRKEQSPAVVAETADMRARAFTLLTDAYDNARRAIIYLRWHEGDADIICPSLFAGRSNGRGKAADASGNKPATPGANPTPNANPTPAASGNGSNDAARAASISANGPFVS